MLVVYDFDGVLVRSDKLIFEAIKEVACKQGYCFENSIDEYRGQGMIEITKNSFL